MAGERDVIHYFTVPLRSLPTDYASRVENFLHEYLGTPEHPVPFGGREKELRTLTAWLEDTNAPPYLLLAAPAGRGKSALLVRWAASLRAREDIAVVFVPVSIRFNTNLYGVTFAILAAQLAWVYGKKLPEKDEALETWQAFVTETLKESPPDGKWVVVVVDGLDKAADWTPSADMFPYRPGERVRVVVSARLTAIHPTPEDWLRTLGWDRSGLARIMTLTSLSREGVADVLIRMGGALEKLGHNANIVAELYRLTEGDPLLVRLYVDDLWARGEEAARLRPEDLRDIYSGYKGYFKRWWEDQRKLWGEKAPLKERAVREVLNLLACALGPLTEEDLLTLADENADLDPRTLEEALRAIERLVVGDREQGYILAHPKLGEYFRDEVLGAQVVRRIKTRFLRWGEEVLTALEEGRLAPKDAPAYVMHYYPIHLIQAGAPSEALRRLRESKAWARAWEALLAQQQELKLSINPQALSDQPSEEDFLGYQLYAEVLADFIKHEQTGKPLTLAITAPWGMGKTTLMRMIQRRLQSSGAETPTSRGRRLLSFVLSPVHCIRDFLRPAKSRDTFPTVWFEAWKYDKEESLWAALVLEILSQVRRQVGRCRWARTWLSLYWKRLDKAGIVWHFAKSLIPALGLYLVGLGAACVYARAASIDWARFAPYAWLAGAFAILLPALRALYQGFRAALPFDFNAYVRQPDYQARIGFLAEFERDFAHVVEAITQNGRWPLVVFIDDLDRCAPPKPVEIIEAINHLVDAKHCVFIIGMDEHMIARSIEVKYAQLADTAQDPGGRTLGTYFLEKIVQLQFRIPPPEEARMRHYVDQLLGPLKEDERLALERESTSSPEEEKSKAASKVRQAAEVIQAERRAGVGRENMEEAVQAAKRKLAEFSEDVWEEAKRQVEIRFGESAQVRETIYRALPYLGGNPRQIKRFINAFRLQTMLSKRLNLIEDTPEHLVLQAKAVITWMRWPVLAQTAVTKGDTFSDFHRACSVGSHGKDETYAQALERLPRPIRPLVQVGDVRRLMRGIAEKDLPLFLRLLGTAEITAGFSPQSSPNEEPTSDHTASSEGSDEAEAQP